MRKNPVYSKEFKAQCVKVLEESLEKETLAEVAERVSVNKNTLYGWYRKQQTQGEEWNVATMSDTEKTTHLMRENILLNQECKLLRELNEVLQKRKSSPEV